MTATVVGAGGERTSRIILLASLALNLFFLGAVGAIAVRHYLRHAPGVVVLAPSRTAAERIDRLAATLPPEDAEKLRSEFRANQTALETAHAAYRKAQDTIRAELRSEPFNVAALRSAMAHARAAKQALDVALQDVIAAAASQMSSAGRVKLSEWSPAPHATAQPNR